MGIGQQTARFRGAIGIQTCGAQLDILEDCELEKKWCVNFAHTPLYGSIKGKIEEKEIMV